MIKPKAIRHRGKHYGANKAMRRNVIAVSMLVWFGAMLPVKASAQEKASEHEHMAGAQQVVRIGKTSLVPESLTIKDNEIVAWINYSGVPVEISFSGETVEKILCKEPTRFHLATDGSLTSGEIQPFETAALCTFQPGEYRYSVRREVSAGIIQPVTQQSSGLLISTQ